MQLSIVLISWNTLPMLQRCLQSLQPLMTRKEVEVIWVDNGSTDGSADFVRSAFPEVSSYILPENKGVAYARNRGVVHSAGRYILFLDDDTESTPEAIDTLIEYLDLHPDTGIAACALRDADGLLQDSFKPYPGLWRKVCNVVRSKCRLKRAEVKLPASVIHPVYVIGACQLIRREVFEQVGLLDEAIFYGPEDADFCLRASMAGWKIAYLPQVSIIHKWRRITSRSLTSRASRAHIRALIYFWLKYRRL